MIEIIQTYHHTLAMPVFDKRVPKTFYKAQRDPTWLAAINTELGKFAKNDCFVTVPFTNQRLVPMMWLFSIKTDGTHKARPRPHDPWH